MPQAPVAPMQHQCSTRAAPEQHRLSAGRGYRRLSGNRQPGSKPTPAQACVPRSHGIPGLDGTNSLMCSWTVAAASASGMRVCRHAHGTSARSAIGTCARSAIAGSFVHASMACHFAMVAALAPAAPFRKELMFTAMRGRAPRRGRGRRHRRHCRGGTTGAPCPGARRSAHRIASGLRPGSA
jgi:hypothetical protein